MRLFVRKSRNKRPLLLVMLRAAESDLSDADLVQRVSTDVHSRTADAHQALDMLGERRDRFDMDRAYRILDAVIHNREVEPIRSDRREMFEQERALGHAPIVDAVEMLARRSPSLRASLRLHGQASATLRELRENSLEGQDPIVESELAASILEQYWSILNGSTEPDLSRSYFELPGKSFVLTTRFDNSV